MGKIKNTFGENLKGSINDNDYDRVLIESWRTMYDKNGEVIKDGDILYMPNDKAFKAIRNKKSIDMDQCESEGIELVKFNSDTIIDNVSHRKWDKNEKIDYVICQFHYYTAFALMLLLSIFMLWFGLVVIEVEAVEHLGLNIAISIFTIMLFVLSLYLRNRKIKDVRGNWWIEKQQNRK